MLRDKFIHYFQQWRERQLSRGEHWLAQHLAGRSPREKGMLLAAVVFLFSVGYYVLIWQPLSERIERTRCPVNDAWTAISAVSVSRISPTITTSGS